MDLKRAVCANAIALGFDKLKDKKIAAMTSFLKGNYTFVPLPTGYGKSIIYAALPLAFDKLKGTDKDYICFCS